MLGCGHGGGKEVRGEGRRGWMVRGNSDTAVHKRLNLKLCSQARGSLPGVDAYLQHVTARVGKQVG